ncbi:acyl carrier protein [uncultured Pseudoteredinibacter sp.]|uniref:acyl carrier protein n=1 Tax=uncultured Pseudoteredinibacter sp. TaxID=1641701 RepID=UPI002620F327|nr:acyl carrier protein [uncultured Pseudoteredinibacter sp.]
MSKYSEEQISQKVSDVICELFELDADEVTPQANLYEDLDIDSIDAVDLVVELKKWSGKKIQPEDFKSVRTVEDVIQAVIELMKE